jgi:hypothetical protein
MHAAYGSRCVRAWHDTLMQQHEAGPELMPNVTDKKTQPLRMCLTHDLDILCRAINVNARAMHGAHHAHTLEQIVCGQQCARHVAQRAMPAPPRRRIDDCADRAAGLQKLGREKPQQRPAARCPPKRYRRPAPDRPT